MYKAVARHVVTAAAMFFGTFAISNAGAAVTIPATFEAEGFDAGGEGVGYHHDTPGNQGNAKYPTGESVDNFPSNDPAGGGFNPEKISHRGGCPAHAPAATRR